MSAESWAGPDRLVAEGLAAVAAAGPDVRAQAVAALEWAGRTFAERVVVASSMGDTVLVHLVSEVVPGADVLFLDTGYHFVETLGTRDAVASTYDVRVRTLRPLLTIEQQAAEHGADLFARDPDRCCAIRKVEPLERGLADYDAWVSGLRRDDAPTRTAVPVVGWDARRKKVKVNPIAGWSDADVAAYAQEHGVLENPLRQIGYASIGCAPCTRPVAPGDDARSGRWAGRAKTECGLHQ